MEKKERGFYNLFYSVCTERFSCCYFTEHLFFYPQLCTYHTFLSCVFFLVSLLFFSFFVYNFMSSFFLFLSSVFLQFYVIFCKTVFSLLLFSVVLHFPSDLFFVVVKKLVFLGKELSWTRPVSSWAMVEVESLLCIICL